MMTRSLLRRTIVLAAGAAVFAPGAIARADAAGTTPAKPNIIVIMSDDMGYSDIGAYGGEIRTPNLDALAKDGVRFTQFYNTARCCPSRAALLTGLYPHRAGIGYMLQNTPHPGYSTNLSSETVTMAEALKPAGYRTYAVGKWHVTHSNKEDYAFAHWPLQRGFEKYYGIIGGSASFFDPATLARGNELISSRNDPEYKPDNYYITDAFTDNTIKFIDEHQKESPDKPFFVYLTYTAAHWPLHAPEEDIARYKGHFDAGYEALRQARFERVKELGLIPKDFEWSPTVGDWSEVEDKAWDLRQMETYAAMVTSMDTGIGKIVDKLKAENLLDNTLILYMQDNGGCAEEIGRNEVVTGEKTYPPMKPEELQKHQQPVQTRDGRAVRRGPGVMAGTEDTYMGYGEKWANVSNTPFTLYKHWVHEGGISTPLIAHWPKGIPQALKNQFVREPGHLVDIMATVIDVADASYPANIRGLKTPPLAGKSLLPLLQEKEFERGGPIYWEHEGNRALREGDWKIVTRGSGPWELYDIAKDRGEQHNLADKHPEKVKELVAKWDKWAAENQVLPLDGWQQGSRRAPHRNKQLVFDLKQGDELKDDKRPELMGRAIRVDANIAEWGNRGVVVSQGGIRQGFSVYSDGGKAAFAIRRAGKLTVLKTEEPLEEGKPAKLVARLRANGIMTLRVNGDEPLRAEVEGGLLPDTPIDGLTVGNDPGGPVAEYSGSTKFNGKIDNVKLRLVQH